MKELLSYMVRHHEDLEKSFTNQQKEIFEKFNDCYDGLTDMNKSKIFAYAFRFGIGVAIEVLLPDKCPYNIC